MELGIWNTGWPMYHIILNCVFAFMNTTFWWLKLVASGMWPLSFVFVGPLVAQHNLQFLALVWLPRWLNIICMDMGIPTFGCAVRFNPWYVMISQAEAPVRINLHAFGWLLSSFHSFGWRIISGLVGNLLFVAYSISLGCYVIFHCQAFSFGNTVWAMFLEEYPLRTQVA